MKALHKKIGIALGLGLTMWALSLGLSATSILGSTELSLGGFLYKTRPVSDEIVIVGIDQASIEDTARGGLGYTSDWPYTYYGKAIQTIEQGNPSSILLDVIFTESSSGISAYNLVDMVAKEPTYAEFGQEILRYLDDPHPIDEAFAEVLKNFDNVFFITLLTGEPYLEQGLYHYGSALELAPFLKGLVTPVASNNGLGSNSTNNASIYGVPAVVYSEDELVEANVTQLVRQHLDLAEAGKWDEQTEIYELGALKIPFEDGKMLINYAGKPYSFKEVSFKDVFNGKVDPAVFENRIVLIGATTPVFQDVYFTPIDSNVRMPGIEIQANAIQTILEQKFLVNQSLLDFGLVLGVLLLVSVVVFMQAPVLWGSALLATELILFPFYAQWRFGHGVIVDLIWTVFALIAAYLAVLLYRNFTEFAEKRKLTEAFGRYVSPELVKQIGEHPELLKLGGERRAITALFLDIENFTNLSEGLEPQAVVSVINTYFDALSKVIMAHGGTVDKYEGDAIMALFGAPVPSQDHGLKACETALAIREKMTELNASTGYKLNIRIGLATGDAIVGNMGSENRFDYTAMGDTVNTASRLEGANKFYSTRILVTEGTYEAAKGQFFMRQVDRVCLKGKDKALAIYEVLGLLSGASEDGQKVIADWHRALESYRLGQWDAAEKGFRAVLATLPDDGPSKTLLGRIATLRMTALKDWDGIWKFESK